MSGVSVGHYMQTAGRIAASAGFVSMLLLASIQEGSRPESARIELNGSKVRVVVESGRPLAEIADVLSDRFLLPINYEDPVSYCAEELADVTAEVSRVPNPSRRTLVPKKVRLDFVADLPELPKQNSDSRRIVLGILARVQAVQGRPYEVLDNGQWLYLRPRGYRDGKCKYVEGPSIMSTRISIGSGTRQARLALKELIDQLMDKTGRQIGLGAAPWNILSQANVNIVATNEPAASVLTRILQETGWRMVWNIRTSSEADMAFINIKRVEHRKEDLLTGGEKKYYFPALK